MNKADWSAEGIIKVLGYYITTAYFATLNYLELTSSLLGALSIAMLLDTVLGIWKAKKLKIKPTSRIGWRGLLGKVLGLLLVGAVGAIFKLGFNVESLVFVNVAMSLMLVYELYSMVAHAYTLWTGIKTKEYDAISIMLRYLLDWLRKFAEVMIKKSYPKNDEENEA